MNYLVRQCQFFIMVAVFLLYCFLSFRCCPVSDRWISLVLNASSRVANRPKTDTRKPVNNLEYGLIGFSFAALI